MSKKPKNAPTPVPPLPPSQWQWLTTSWAVMVAVGAVVGAVLLNINPILSNVRQLPSEVRKTSDQFSSWYYQDDAWSGYWTSTSEGHVDAEDMNLSEERIAIDLEVKNGVIDGTIATPQICESIPVLDFLLLRGKVGAVRSSATVIVWDTFQGHKRDIAALELKRDGVVMSIVPKEGVLTLFPSRARIALDRSDAPPATPFCVGEQEAFAKMLEQMLKERQATVPQVKDAGR